MSDGKYQFKHTMVDRRERKVSYASTKGGGEERSTISPGVGFPTAARVVSVISTRRRHGNPQFIKCWRVRKGIGVQGYYAERLHFCDWKAPQNMCGHLLPLHFATLPQLFFAIYREVSFPSPPSALAITYGTVEPTVVIISTYRSTDNPPPVKSSSLARVVASLSAAVARGDSGVRTGCLVGAARLARSRASFNGNRMRSADHAHHRSRLRVRSPDACGTMGTGKWNNDSASKVERLQTRCGTNSARHASFYSTVDTFILASRPPFTSPPHTLKKIKRRFTFTDGLTTHPPLSKAVINCR